MSQVENLQAELVRRIQEVAQPHRIILFGSRARGTARPDSDFDILVIQDSHLPRHRRAGPLYTAVAKVPAEVEIMVFTPEEVEEWREVPEAFVTTALREGKVVYEREE